MGQLTYKHQRQWKEYMNIRFTQQQIQKIEKLFASQNVSAMDDKWITVKPNGPNHKGKPVRISDDGTIIAGMGGKFNGQKINTVKKSEAAQKNQTIIDDIRKVAPEGISDDVIKEMATWDKERLDNRLKIWERNNSRRPDSGEKTSIHEQSKIGSAATNSVNSENRAAEGNQPLTSKRLDRLLHSLEKKQVLADRSIEEHSREVRARMGQPFHRSEASTLNRFRRQEQAIKNKLQEVKKTERAIEREKELIKRVHSTKLPNAINEAIQSGEITQWRKYPNRFFVKGVEKGRIIWDEQKGQLLNSHYSQIPEEQKPIFKKAFYDLKEKLSAHVSELAEKRKNVSQSAYLGFGDNIQALVKGKKLGMKYSRSKGLYYFPKGIEMPEEFKKYAIDGLSVNERIDLLYKKAKEE